MIKIISLIMLVILAGSNASAYRYSKYNLEIDFPDGWESGEGLFYGTKVITTVHKSGNAVIKIVTNGNAFHRYKKFDNMGEAFSKYINDKILYPMATDTCKSPIIIGNPHRDIINGNKAVVSDFTCGKDPMTYIAVFGNNRTYVIWGFSRLKDKSVMTTIKKSLCTFKIIE
ncbi:hypothetical protein [Pelobacter propionicus]|nr:hypothetical protein [Pelobacter propionicus]